MLLYGLLCAVALSTILAGVLLQGAVANFVETEQLVFLEGGRLLASYTQVTVCRQITWLLRLWLCRALC